MGTEASMSSRAWRCPGLTVCAGLSVGLLLMIVPYARAIAVAKHPGRHEVTFGLDKVEPGRLVGSGIQVSRGGRPTAAKPRTIYSVRLPRVRRDQRLLVRGTVALTRCNESDQRPGGGAHHGTLHSPCESVRHPYGVPGGGRYDPEIAVRAFLGSERSDLHRGLGTWQVRRCTTALHHCPLNVRTRVDHVKHRSGPLWLNLAVTAFSREARLGPRGRRVDVVQLDGNCKRHDYDPCKPVLK